MNRSDFLKRASSSGAGIYILVEKKTITKAGFYLPHFEEWLCYLLVH